MAKFAPKVTEKGTELPILDLRGRQYLEVKWRMVWFREKFPEGSIQTEVREEGDIAYGRATIAVPINGNYIVLATGHKKEKAGQFPDYYEKVETGAIGRALAAAGFGTQFEPEFDEEGRLADAPIETKKGRSVISTGPGGTNTARPQKAQAPGEKDPTGIAGGTPVNVAAANAELRVVKAGESIPAQSAEDEEAYTKKLIAAAADEIVNARKVKTASELKQTLQEKYGVTNKNALNSAQAKEFLGYLNTLTA